MEVHTRNPSTHFISFLEDMMDDWNTMTQNQLRAWLEQKVKEYLENGGKITKC